MYFNHKLEKTENPSKKITFDKFIYQNLQNPRKHIVDLNSPLILYNKQ